MVSESVFALANQLGEHLMQRHWQATCAESCTGGGIGYAITSVAGSSNWFQQGFITYSNEAKVQQLKVDNNTLSRHGAVSEAVVAQMAEGAAIAANANVAVAVSGIAGPGGGTATKPVGTVCFGFYVDGEVRQETQVFSGDRESIRQATITHALQWLNRALCQ